MRPQFRTGSSILGLALATVILLPSSALATGQPISFPTNPLPSAVVPIVSVSNGCGPGKASAGWRIADTSTYYDSGKSYTVSFRAACDMHDAAYSGAKVVNPVDGGVVDTFFMTRLTADQDFLKNMQKLCDRHLPASATSALAKCKGSGSWFSTGAITRLRAVEKANGYFYTERPHVAGTWKDSILGYLVTVAQAGRIVTMRWSSGGTNQDCFRGVIVTGDQDLIIRGVAKVLLAGGVYGPAVENPKVTFTIANDKPDVMVVGGTAPGDLLTRQP